MDSDHSSLNDMCINESKVNMGVGTANKENSGFSYGHTSCAGPGGRQNMNLKMFKFMKSSHMESNHQFPSTKTGRDRNLSGPVTLPINTTSKMPRLTSLIIEENHSATSNHITRSHARHKNDSFFKQKLSNPDAPLQINEVVTPNTPPSDESRSKKSKKRSDEYSTKQRSASTSTKKEANATADFGLQPKNGEASEKKQKTPKNLSERKIEMPVQNLNRQNTKTRISEILIGKPNLDIATINSTSIDQSTREGVSQSSKKG